MKGIIYNLALVIVTSVTAGAGVFATYMLIRIGPHGSDFYLQPYWHQVVTDASLAMALAGMPVLAAIAWWQLYHSLRAYDRKERAQ